MINFRTYKTFSFELRESDITETPGSGELDQEITSRARVG